MRRIWLLLCCSGALACAAELSGVHTVYLLPMGRGLDQFLANRLTNARLFQVVTDPKKADAIFTDRIGESLQAQLDNLYPPPEPPKPAEAPEKKEGKKGKEEEPRGQAPITDTVNKLSSPGLNSTFGRARGTVFLVDAKSRQVVWSAYDPPKSATGNDLDRTASDIVSRLKKELAPAKN